MKPCLRKKRSKNHEDFSVGVDHAESERIVGNQERLDEPTKKKLKSFTYEEKKKILVELNEVPQEIICKKYNLSARTLRYWVSKKEEIFENAKNINSRNVKRIRDTQERDDQLLQWMVENQVDGIPVSGPLLKKRALIENKNLHGRTNFKASEGWLSGWKKRKHIRFKITGEKLSADVAASEKYTNEKLPKLTGSKQSKNNQIFKCNESCLIGESYPDSWEHLSNMPSRCAVPNCPSNTIRCKKSRSTFKVPDDAEMRSKWTDAIPGKCVLAPLQRICENHFEENVIIRAFVKRDESGKILAQVPLKRPHLEKGAMPTLFTQNSKPTRHKPMKQVLSDDVKDVDSNTVYSHTEHTYCSTSNEVEESEEEEETMDIDAESKKDLPQCSTVPIENTEDGVEQSDIKPTPDCIRFALVTFQDLELKTESQEYSTISIESTQDRVEEAPESNVATISNCISFASVTFQFDVKSDESTHGPMTLPKPWNVCKSRVGEKEILVFTYAVVNSDHREERYIFEKTVVINSSREIQYDIYSTPVNVEGTKLPRFLDDVNILADILKSFKNMRVCKGTAGVVVTGNTASKSYIGTDRRHKDCTLLSITRERCFVCRQLTKALSQKSRRLEKWKLQHGVSSPSDTVEQVKLKTLQQKLKLRTKTIYRLKRRLELLTGSSTEQ